MTNSTPNNTIASKLCALHLAARRLPALYRLALISRVLLALAFLPSSLVKVMGQRFTRISTSDPIGYFFEAMYQTGLFWRFIGASQLVAVALLLIPATATLGAAMFLPITVNIFVITVSLHFTGTPVITGLMLLANVFLVCWDYHKFASVLFGPSAAYDVAESPWFPRIEVRGYQLGAATGSLLVLWTRDLVPGTLRGPALVTCGVAAAMAVGMVVIGWFRASRTPALSM